MKLVTDALFAQLIERAAASPRRRSHHNLHEQADDPVQRLFIAAKRDSYFRVHRHPAKWEFSMVVRGAFDVLIFDDLGLLIRRARVGPHADVCAFELPPNTFHTWLPLEDDSIFFEVKEGPYDAATAAEFAAWAPAEGAPEALDFVRKLTVAVIGDCLAQ